MYEILSANNFKFMLFVNIWFTIVYIIYVYLLWNKIKLGTKLLFTFSSKEIEKYHKIYGPVNCIVSTLITCVLLIITLTISIGWIGYAII